MNLAAPPQSPSLTFPFYAVSIYRFGTEQVVVLHYQTHSAALGAALSLSTRRQGETIRVADDLGRSLLITPESIAAVLLSDVAAEIGFQGTVMEEQNLVNARMQARFQRRAQSDPVLNLNAPGLSRA